jgi:RNA polymerase sigma-70 factor (ECF subfamily)
MSVANGGKITAVREPRNADLAVREAIAARRADLLALVRRAGVGADAEDVLQRALERALVRSAQLRDPERAGAWIVRVVKNAVIDELRGRPAPACRFEDLEDEPPAHDENACGCVLAQAGRLKPEYAFMLRRVDVEGAAVTEVATELGITPNNAMVRLHRARQALRKQMKEHCGTTTARSCSDCGCEERGCCPPP